MTMNKQLQYGLLFCLYLSRAGRATVSAAAVNLNLSKAFLNQVALKLKISGILFSFKGPGGGYELKEEARMVEVFTCLSPFTVLSNDEAKTYAAGGPEYRALFDYAKNLGSSSYIVLRRTVRDVMNALVANEVKHFGLLDIHGLEQ